MSLKTLKDTQLFFKTRFDLEKEFLDHASKRNLKICPMNVIGWVQHKIKGRIRKEAIKWINTWNRSSIDYYQTHKKILNTLAVNIYSGGKIHKVILSRDVIEFIKFYHNIAEEDLK